LYQDHPPQVVLSSFFCAVSSIFSPKSSLSSAQRCGDDNIARSKEPNNILLEGILSTDFKRISGSLVLGEVLSNLLFRIISYVLYFVSILSVVGWREGREGVSSSAKERYPCQPVLTTILLEPSTH
ncbi:unnamed protein product, partial [Choristocarpus tenellus]